MFWNFAHFLLLLAFLFGNLMKGLIGEAKSCGILSLQAGLGWGGSLIRSDISVHLFDLI